MRGQVLRRGLVAALGVLLLALMLAGLVSAAQAAGPASLLCPVKLAWEDVRLALTWEPQARFALAQDLAGARVEEIAGLVQAGQDVPSPPLDRLERLLRLELEAAARLDDRQMVGALEQMVEIQGFDPVAQILGKVNRCVWTRPCFRSADHRSVEAAPRVSAEKD